ncbi:MAG: VanW family protein [Candidatus Falkowbacteria bacterium]
MKTKLKKYFYISVASVCCLAIFLLSFYWFYIEHYDGKIYPGVSIDSIDLSNKTKTEAETLIQAKVNSVLQNDFKFTYNNRSVLIPSVLTNFKDNAKQNLVTINYNQLLDSAYAVGRQDNYLLAGEEQFRVAVFGKKMDFNLVLDKEALQNELHTKFADMETMMSNPKIKVSLDSAGNPKYEISNETPGLSLNYVAATNELENNLKKINSPEIILSAVSTKPSVSKNQITNVDAEIKNFTDQAPFNLAYNNTSSAAKVNVAVAKNDLVSWLQLDDNGHVALSSESIGKYLNKKIAPLVNQDIKEARFAIANNRVSTFQVGTDGLALNSTNTSESIKNYFNNPSNKNINLVVDVVPNKGVKVADNTLMIKEIVGTGHSNFKGSPVNRRRNIAVGSAKINGLMIAPGSEFSLVSALGSVEKEDGYLPELVIKENKTIPEFGGGLCQVATTLFRAALQSGLPITARSNHSYRVSYYEPAGTDAAVYLPNPDVKFINDTGNYILIQTRTLGNDLYFDFWGVKDGRKIEVGAPTIYNIVKPAPTKLLESTDIPVGTKKCTEHAHNGADAWFDYKVTYNPGSDTQAVKQKRFSSHYVPWQEVCLVGVKTLSANVSSTAVSSIVPTAEAVIVVSTSTTATR